MTRHFDRVRNISLFLIIFLAAVYCAGFDVSVDSFSSGGSITGKSVMPVSHSMVSLVHSGIREDTADGSSRGHDLEKATASSDLQGRIMRKLLTDAGSNIPSGVQISFRTYVLLICTSACISLFCPVFIRFIHLKDGSK